MSILYFVIFLDFVMEHTFFNEENVENAFVLVILGFISDFSLPPN